MRAARVSRRSHSEAETRVGNISIYLLGVRSWQCGPVVWELTSLGGGTCIHGVRSNLCVDIFVFFVHFFSGWFLLSYFLPFGLFSLYSYCWSFTALRDFCAIAYFFSLILHRGRWQTYEIMIPPPPLQEMLRRIMTHAGF